VVQSDVYDKQICDLETLFLKAIINLRKVRNNHALRSIKSEQEIHNCGSK
jgi:hypothetical protein